jgi:fibronectin type 3 domain-containing protein
MQITRLARQMSLVSLVACSVLCACNKRAADSDSLSPPHSATLKWTASTSNIAGYRIFRSSILNASPGLLGVTGPTDTQYVDRSVEAGKTYYYSVKAFDFAGRESTAANISATIPSNSPQ